MNGLGWVYNGAVFGVQKDIPIQIGQGDRAAVTVQHRVERMLYCQDREDVSLRQGKPTEASESFRFPQDGYRLGE